MNSKDIKPWRERLKKRNPHQIDYSAVAEELADAEISELRQALVAAEKQVAALSFIQGKGLTDCDMHDDESN